MRLASVGAGIGVHTVVHRFFFQAIGSCFVYFVFFVVLSGRSEWMHRSVSVHAH